jgi:hypothetical protein
MVVEKYLLCPENFFGMSGKFCRMFVDMSGKFFFGEILMFSLPVRANYTVPLQTRLAHTPMLRRELTSLKKSKFLLEFFR